MSWRQFHQLLTAVRLHWFGVVSFVLIGAAAAAVLSIVLPVSFHATARVFIASPDWNDNTSSATPDGKGQVVTYAFGDEFTQRRAISYSKMIDSELVAAAVINQLNLKTTPSELASRISSRVVPDTVMIDVTVRDTTAQGAADIANATAKQVIELIKRLETPSNSSSHPSNRSCSSRQTHHRGPRRPAWCCTYSAAWCWDSFSD